MSDTSFNPSGGYGHRLGIKTVTATAYMPRPEDHTILADATSAAIVLNLKSSTKRGQVFMIQKTDSSVNAVTVKNKDGVAIVVLDKQNSGAYIHLNSLGVWEVIVFNAPCAAKDIHSSGQRAFSAADGVDTTPSTTETYATRILIPRKMKLTGIRLFNGSDVTGNVRVGLADAAGTPIAGALTASTAGSGVDSYQAIPFAAAYDAVAGYYLVCIQYSSATARFNAHGFGSDFSIVETGSTYGTMPTIDPLPTAVVAAAANIFSLY